MSSSPTIAFEIDHAVKYGVDAACLLYHFRHWIEINHASQRNFYDGCTWSYQSQHAIIKHFPWMSRATLQRKLEELCSESGPLKKGNYNKSRYDRTVWYAFKNEDQWIRATYKTEQCIAQNEAIDSLKMGNAWPQNETMENIKVGHPLHQSGPTIPDYNPDDKNKKITPPASPSPKKKAESASDQGKEIANYLFEKIKTINLNHKPPDLNDWGLEVDRMIRIDKREPSEIIRIIDWAHSDSFWKGNILSTHKLRQQFDTLLIKSSPATPKASVVDDAQAFLARVAMRFAQDNEMSFSPDGITFQAGQSYFTIKVSEHAFKEKVLNQLRKWNRRTDGL